MKDTIGRLEEITEKVVTLHEKGVALERHNADLRAENNELRMHLDGAKKDLTDKDEKIKTLGIAKRLSDGDDDRTELKKRINGYIREIDKCLSILNQ